MKAVIYLTPSEKERPIRLSKTKDFGVKLSKFDIITTKIEGLKMQKKNKLQEAIDERAKILDKQELQLDNDFQKAHKAVQAELLKPEVMAVFQRLRDR